MTDEEDELHVGEVRVTDRGVSGPAGSMLRLPAGKHIAVALPTAEKDERIVGEAVADELADLKATALRQHGEIRRLEQQQHDLNIEAGEWKRRALAAEAFIEALAE